MAVRHHGGIGQRASATADDRECQHMPPVHDEPALPPPLAVAEVDALDGLRKAPDAAAGLAGEALVDGELPDPRGESVDRQVDCPSQIRDRRGRRTSPAYEEGQR